MRERSREKERLDEPGLDPQILKQNLSEIETINRWLGGHKINTTFLDRVMAADPTRHLHVLDLGCGGGDTLRALILYARKRNWHVTGTGADLHPVCIEYSRERSRSYPELSFQIQDCLQPGGLPEADIVMANLFTHHLYDQDLYALLKTMRAKARLGALINDLHRHPLAEQSIRLLTRVARGSAYVQHDAPASVRKGFIATELRRLVDEAGWPRNSLVKWHWAFRYEVSYMMDTTT